MKYQEVYRAFNEEMKKEALFENQAERANEVVRQRTSRSLGQMFSNMGLTTVLAALLARKKLRHPAFSRGETTFLGGLAGLWGSTMAQGIGAQLGRFGNPYSSSDLKKYLKADSISSYLVPGKAGYQQGRFARSIQDGAARHPLKLLSLLSQK